MKSNWATSKLPWSMVLVFWVNQRLNHACRRSLKASSHVWSWVWVLIGAINFQDQLSPLNSFFEATHVAAAVDLSLFVQVIIYQSFFYSKQFVAASLPMDISCKFNLAYNCCHQKKNYLKRKIDCDTENNLTDVAI